MTTTKYAIKAMEKAGARVEKVRDLVIGKIGDQRIEFYDQDGDVTCLCQRRVTDLNDSKSDYVAGIFCDSIERAIKYAKRYHQQDWVPTAY